MRRLLLFLAVSALAFGIAAARPAGASAGDTTAVAINTKDGSSVFRFAFHVSRVMGDVVDESNAAVAFASCDSCQTVAISIQIVLVMGDPEVVTPENLAIAINEGCNLCETLASAYQYVFGTGGPVHFTAEGNQALAEIRRQFLALRNSGLSIEEIQARVEELTQQLAQVLANELVKAGYEATVETTPPPPPATPPPAPPPSPPPPPAETTTTPTTTTTTTQTETTGSTETTTTETTSTTTETTTETTP